MTEAEFFLWVAFIATMPEDIDVNKSVWKDFHWQEYIATLNNESDSFISRFEGLFNFSCFAHSPAEIMDKINKATK